MDNLPNELWPVIISFNTITKTLLELRTVNKQLQSIIESDEFWLNFFSTSFNDFTSRYIEYKHITECRSKVDHFWNWNPIYTRFSTFLYSIRDIHCFSYLPKFSLIKKHWVKNIRYNLTDMLLFSWTKDENINYYKLLYILHHKPRKMFEIVNELGGSKDEVLQLLNKLVEENKLDYYRGFYRLVYPIRDHPKLRVDLISKDTTHVLGSLTREETKQCLYLMLYNNIPTIEPSKTMTMLMGKS